MWIPACGSFKTEFFKFILTDSWLQNISARLYWASVGNYIVFILSPVLYMCKCEKHHASTNHQSLTCLAISIIFIFGQLFKLKYWTVLSLFQTVRLVQWRLVPENLCFFCQVSTRSTDRISRRKCAKWFKCKAFRSFHLAMLMKQLIISFVCTDSGRAAWTAECYSIFPSS